MANKIRVSIAGTTYTLVSDEAPAYMQKIAAEVDSAIDELMRTENSGIVNTTTAAVLCAVNKTDAVYKEKQTSDRLREQTKRYADDAAFLARQLEKAKKEIEALKAGKA